MLGGINPKQMQGMMKKMGISQNQIDAKRVIIECADKNIVIDEPSVLKISMQGQVSYQVSGEERELTKYGNGEYNSSNNSLERVEEREESTEVFSEDDVEMVVEKTGRQKEEVVDFLKKNNGDIALAILELK